MADNYLERRQQELQEKRPVVKHTGVSLDSLLKKNRSYRGYDPSRVVTEDELKQIVQATTLAASGMNKQRLRYRLVTKEEAEKILPNITLGAALPEDYTGGMYLPQYAIHCGGSLGQQMLWQCKAADDNIHVATAEDAANSPWVAISTSPDTVAAGEYYLDFAGLGSGSTFSAPDEETLALLNGGEWYVDHAEGLVTGFVTLTEHDNTLGDYTITEQIPANAELYDGAVKVKAADTVDAGENTTETDAGTGDAGDSAGDTGFTDPIFSNTVFGRICEIVRNFMNWVLRVVGWTR